MPPPPSAALPVRPVPVPRALEIATAWGWRLLELHPLAVVGAITSGLVLAGIVGGVLAVPLLAMVVTFVRSLASPQAVPLEEEDATGPHADGGPAEDDGPAPGTVVVAPAGEGAR